MTANEAITIYHKSIINFLGYTRYLYTVFTIRICLCGKGYRSNDHLFADNDKFHRRKCFQI